MDLLHSYIHLALKLSWHHNLNRHVNMWVPDGKHIFQLLWSFDMSPSRPHTLSLVENWQETCVQSSKLVWFNSPCSPARDAYSLDECQDTLEEEDEEEGHEVEWTISPENKGWYKRKQVSHELLYFYCRVASSH